MELRLNRFHEHSVSESFSHSHIHSHAEFTSRWFVWRRALEVTPPGRTSRSSAIRVSSRRAIRSSFRRRPVMAQRKPEKVFRIGFVSASIFAHEVGSQERNRTFYSASIQKRYVENDESKYTSSFGLAELPQALRLLPLVQEWIEQREAEVLLGE